MAANTHSTHLIRRITVVTDVNTNNTVGYLSKVVSLIQVEEKDTVVSTRIPIRVF